MEAAVLSGFINAILPRLLSLVQAKYKLHKGLKSNINSLEKELRMIAVTIDEQILLGKDDHGAVLSLSMDELRELAHQIEDCVDRFLYHVTREQQASLLRRTVRSPKSLLSRQRLAAEVQRLKKIPEEAHQRGERYRVFSGGLSSSLTRRAESSPCSSGSGDPHTLKADLVGIDSATLELVQQLAASEGEKLKVISIVGIHGSGKTVLAREVYDSDVGRQFSLRAWVSATDRCPREVLMEILRKLVGPVEDNSNVDQLTVQLMEHLGEKRYFIIIDDMQTDQWSAIEAAFPKDNVVSSRVIVTTTIQSVANACSSSNGYVHKMKRLSDKHSERLFTKKACPENYLGYTRAESKEILKKCDGQPLALVTMAQFLRKNGWPTGPNCEDVCRHLSHHLGKDETLERMRRVLIHSFSSLPGHGPKACLLYFGMFPCDHPIRRKTLMRRWLAEGFVETQPLSSEHFNTLIDRNIIEPIGIRNNDQVKTCKTYGMMREFILLMATSQDFITLLSGKKVERKYVRRLSLHHHSATSSSSLDIDLPLVRSLMVFGEAGKVILNFQKYQLLRVLDLEECTDLEDDHLKDICSLLLLKYLSLGETVTSLPKEMEKLKLLETLDLRRTKVKILPIEVLLLPCLLHLFGKFQLSDKVKITSDVQNFFLTEQSNLETLAGFFTDGSQGFPQIMSYMKNLRKLKIWLQRNERSTDFVDLVNAIQKFIHDDKEESNDPRSLSLHFDDDTENILNSLKAPSYLRSLKLKGKSLELPRFVKSMRGLRELCLSSTKLTAGLLAALTNLQDLQHLKLVADELEDFTIEHQAFPGLLHLCLDLQRATLPTIEEGALPYLISLKLICKDLVGLAGIKINHLICLKEVSLHPRVTPETRETWKTAAKEHPNRPKVLLVNPTDDSESEPADNSDASIQTISEAMEISSTSEVVQEDGINKEHPNRPKILFVSPVDESESEPADGFVASTQTISDTMETSTTSEVAVQEDDIQILVNQGLPAAPEKQKNCAVQPSSKDELNSAVNNIGFSVGLTELSIATNGNVPSYTY
ncbi:hypothetical protein BS78_08G036100 [Paspalum vaginatum]|nr:hypothetical protein BS78_08G036100 [Paspalum vaginatum]